MTAPPSVPLTAGPTPGHPRAIAALAPYRAVAVRAFRRFSTYRAATVAGVVTNTVFGFLYAYVFDAVHDDRGVIGGYTPTDTATYVFLAQGFLMMTGTFGDAEISDRIRSGDIAADLYRPVDFQAWWLAHDLGKAAFFLIGRGIPPFVVGLVVLQLPLPGGPREWLLFGPVTLLGVMIAFALRFLANLSAFWLLEARGVVTLMAIAQSLLAGHLVPLFFMPERAEHIVRLLPFAGITAHPVEVLLGGPAGWSAVTVVGHQVVWLTVLLGLGRLLLGRARRKLVIQGG